MLTSKKISNNHNWEQNLVFGFVVRRCFSPVCGLGWRIHFIRNFSDVWSVSLITSQSEFHDLCNRIREAGVVAFDTEFFSESYFRPKLGLLQFAVDGDIVGVDPFQVDDLSEWWKIMIDEIIAREERVLGKEGTDGWRQLWLTARPSRRRCGARWRST